MAEQKLNRTLGLAECIFFGVGSILGAGIYTIVGKVAGYAGNMLWLAFSIASLAALFTAFSYAELSSSCPKTGGEYAYAKMAYPQKVAVILGLMVSLNGTISGAAVSLGFAGYLSDLLPLSGKLASLGIIGVVLLVNISGIRESSRVNIAFTLVEFAGLAFVIYCAWPSFGKADLLELPPGGFNGLLLAAALSFFAYIGFEEIVKLAEETKEPQKNIPRALFIACGIVFIIYGLVAVFAVNALPWEDLARSNSPLAAIAASRFGRTAAIGLAIVALFSTTNTILSNMLGASRVLLDMGDENRWLAPLSIISTKRKTPITALLAVGFIMAAFALIGKIETVALIANFFIFLTFLMINLAVIVLRHRDKEMNRPFKVPFTIGNIPLPSALGLLLTAVLLCYSIYGLTLGIK